MVHCTYQGRAARSGTRRLSDTRDRDGTSGAGTTMMQFDQMQKWTRDGMDVAMRSFGAVSTGAQAAAAQTSDYAKRSFEQGGEAVERLMGARSLDAALQVQAEFLRASCQGLVTQATKMGELASSTAKEAFAPVESFATRSARTA